MNSKIIGEKTEARVLSALLHVYPTVLMPFGDNQRYDMVFEDWSGEFKKVQCKTGRYRNGVIAFNAYSRNSKSGHGVTRPYTSDEIDFFGVACPDFTSIYLVPIGDVTSATPYLRVDPAKNNNSKLITWAKDYVIYDPCTLG